MLLIINNHDSFTYNLVDLVRRVSPIEFTVCTTEKIEIDALSQFTHILISPGPDVPSAYPQLALVLQRYATSKSILGVCLGHQTLCHFFGAQLYNLMTVRHGQEGIVTQSVNNKLFNRLPKSFNVGLYHSWAVKEETLPKSLMPIAFDQDGVLMAVQHRTLPIYGVQFHPESFLTPQGNMILHNWLLRERK